MQKNFEDLNKSGIFGICLFWSRMFLYVTPGCYLAFLGYCVYLCLDSMWTKSQGYTLVVLYSIMIILILCSLFFLFSCHFGLSFPSNLIKNQILMVLTIISLFFSCFILSFLTEKQRYIYGMRITDFVIRNPTDGTVIEFLKNSATQNEEYINSRSNNNYGYVSLFFAIWLIVFVIFEISLALINKEETPLLEDRSDHSGPHNDA